jgi:uncharacterized protein YbjT (DUF2867 family)
MSGGGVVLVTGATGKVGRQVVSGLVAAGATVRAVTRDPGSAGLPPGVQVVPGDLMDPGSLNGHLGGAAAVFLIWPSFSAGGAPALVDALARRIPRVVYLSAMNVQDGRPPEENGVWGQVEHAIGESGAQWTFLRAGGFAGNTLGWAAQIRSGVVRWPYGQAARSLIHEKDIAAVAVLALTEDGRAGAKYVLTGPAAVTQADQVRIIGEVAGHPVRWEDIPPEQARQQLLPIMGDPDVVDGALRYWASLVAQPEPVTSTVAEVTGTPARTFREWAADHAADFR